MIEIDDDLLWSDLWYSEGIIWDGTTKEYDEVVDQLFAKMMGWA